VWGEPTKNGKEIFGFASPLYLSNAIIVAKKIETTNNQTSNFLYHGLVVSVAIFFNDSLSVPGDKSPLIVLITVN